MAVLPLGFASSREFGLDGVDERFSRLEHASSGRLGVSILDLATGRKAEHRADERFPMCSTFKLLAASAVLARVDNGSERLDRPIPFSKADLLEYAPVTTGRVSQGSMTVAELCEAAITVSDNTAANLIVGTLGGPAGVTAYARSLGDSMTRLDRLEPGLNEARPGDVRDTTTPGAMLRNIQRLLLGDALSKRSRETLTAWLIANKTGGARLRAGLPVDWRVGDKTGTGNRGTTNDVAIIWPPRRAPILVTVYLTESSAAARVRERTLADVARLVARGL
jgi:beta-lactamase class A